MPSPLLTLQKVLGVPIALLMMKLMENTSDLVWVIYSPLTGWKTLMLLMLTH